MKKINLIIAIILIVQGCTQNITTVESPIKKIGFEIEDGSKVNIYGGSQEGVAIMEAFFDAYNERRVEDVSKLEHDDIELFAPNGMFIKGSDEHAKLSNMFLEANPNAKWEILWCISNDIDFANKPSENWVTTMVNVSFGEGESETNLQRVLDAQIVDGKIKKMYGYERIISDNE
ncbi:MAG: nuclear transport factor 2 family protein [Flammeovirgaceae bacterium]